MEESLVSDLLRSNCPVTGQPDWGSVQIRYRGRPIDREGLLRYLVSFRTHNEFHEQCVERIYIDLMARCAPERAQRVRALHAARRTGHQSLSLQRTAGAGESRAAPASSALSIGSEHP